MSKPKSQDAFTQKEILSFLNNAFLASQRPKGKASLEGRLGYLREYSAGIGQALEAEVGDFIISREELVCALIGCAIFIQMKREGE